MGYMRPGSKRTREDAVETLIKCVDAVNVRSKILLVNGHVGALVCEVVAHDERNMVPVPCYACKLKCKRNSCPHTS